MHVYIGSYTASPYGSGEGIGVYDFDEQSGALRLIDTASDLVNPSFLVAHPTGRWLYATHETADGGVTALARDPATGRLRAINREASGGADPCYISLDPTGRFVLVANYTGGTVAVLPIGADGRVEPASCVIRHEGSSVNPARQGEPHPHMIAPTPDGRFVLVSDLGSDRIVIYRMDDSGVLMPSAADSASVALPPGAGPRHFAFARGGRTLYVINELASTLTVLDLAPESGAPAIRQTVSTLPPDFIGKSFCAHVVVSPDGRFVYGSNRGHDSIAIFRIDEASGEVTPVWHQPTGGQTPRNFALDPSGRWLLAANQESGSIVTFARDAATGLLTAAGETMETPSPVAIVFCMA